MNTVRLSTLEPEQTILATGTSSWRDSLGIVASVGCAIHCAAMPFVIAYLPALGLSFLADEAFHKWMALACFLIAIAAFVPGIRKHGNWIPVSIAAFGLAFITYAAFGLAGECCPSCNAAPLASVSEDAADAACVECADCEQCDSLAVTEVNGTVIEDANSASSKSLLSSLAPWITPFGGLLLVSAHLMNRRYGCLCGCCGPTESAEAT